MMTTTISKPTKLYPVRVNGVTGLATSERDGWYHLIVFREFVSPDKWQQWTHGEDVPFIFMNTDDNGSFQRITPDRHYAQQFTRLIQLGQDTTRNHEKEIVIRADVFRSLIQNFDASLMEIAQETHHDIFTGNDTYLTLNGYRYAVVEMMEAKALISSASVWWKDDDTIESYKAKQ